MAKKQTDTALAETPQGGEMYVKPGAIQSWDEFEIASVNLNSSYWTPEQGEVRHGIYHGVHNREVEDFNEPGLIKNLPCAVFHDPVADEVFANASAILLGSMAMVPQGTAVRIEYLGKKRSKRGNQCDNWKVNHIARKETA